MRTPHELSQTFRQLSDRLTTGILIDDRYRVEELLGEGGMGVVYKVVDEQTDDILALKLLRPDRLTDEVIVKLAREEARTGWYLNRKGVIHRNIVRTLHLGQWRPPQSSIHVPYFVMEYVEGTTLNHWIGRYSRRNLPPVEQALSYIEQVAEGVACAHHAGLIHRDLKPSNVLLETRTGMAKVTDFGISRRLTEGDESSERVRGFATELWAAPEQSPEHPEAEGFYTDVYTLAKMLYYLLSCRYLHIDYYQHVGGSRHLPSEMDKLIHRACAPTPDDRFPDMTHFLQVFTPICERFRELRNANQEDEEGRPEKIRQRDRRIQELKGTYRFCLEEEFSWDKRLSVLDELLSLGPADAEVVAWREESDEYRRVKLKDDLDQSLRNLDRDRFHSALQEALNLFPAEEVQDWEFRFTMAEAETLASAGSHHDAIKTLKSAILDGQLDRDRREQLLAKLVEWGAVVHHDDVPARFQEHGQARHDREKKRTHAGLPRNRRPLTVRLLLWIVPVVIILAALAIAEMWQYLPMVNRWRNTPDPPSVDTPVRRESALNMGLRYIESGSFTMGSPLQEPGRDADEEQHRVTITSDFWLGETEVTQRQWREIFGNNPARSGSCDDCPVDHLNWFEAVTFANALSSKAGITPCYELAACNGRVPGEGFRCETVVFTGFECRGFRLPTEAEWEFAARGGGTAPFHTGTKLTTQHANYDGRYPYQGESSGKYFQRPLPVQTFPPSSWGFYDLHGNVQEWVWDWYGSYNTHSVVDPMGPSRGSLRVLRGGGWASGAADCRLANRHAIAPESRLVDVGFRVAATAAAEESEHLSGIEQRGGLDGSDRPQQQ